MLLLTAVLVALQQLLPAVLLLLPLLCFLWQWLLQLLLLLPVMRWSRPLLQT